MNYWEYIRVEELLALQGGIDGDESTVSNDESLFIIVHQIYELWFKLILRELTAARDLLQQNPVPDDQLASAVRSLRRVNAVFEQATNHFKLIETMTTRDYLAFRDRLTSASGFQSAQMREIEIVLGLDESSRIPLGPGSGFRDALRTTDGKSSPALERVERRDRGGPSIRQVVYEWLARTPIDGANDDASIIRFVDGFLEAHRREADERTATIRQSDMPEADIERLTARYTREVDDAGAFLRAEDDPEATEEQRAFRRRVRAAIVFLESYRDLPRLTWPRELVDTLLSMEQGMLVWRQRHARMVERVIGRRTGTGGSAGVDYLDQTALRYRVFGDLWAVRTLLLPESAIPAPRNAGAYRFRVED